MGTLINGNDNIPYSICSNPNNCSNDSLAPFHVYQGSPLRGLLNSHRPLKDCGPNHLGAKDLATWYRSPNGQQIITTSIGTPVYAAEAGTILQLSFGWDHCGCNNPNCRDSNFVGIRSDTPDKSITHYVHVSPLPGLKIGDHIMIGQQIGTVDISGDSCGPHVHMARYNQNGIPTCNWVIDITQIPTHSWWNTVFGMQYHPYPYHPHR
ncbi:peptidoglycan DD-metalloendopeptidase family protein [Niallia oryzisoli]|uniref:Peptidoglycan DD-metalloendopeptidase family protein n=1 Tax=Niallia oryzisoli TaxID=1737571 RepID=A0ABZ2CJ43_9BACI